MNPAVALAIVAVLLGLSIGLPTILGGMIGAATASYGWAAFSSVVLHVLLSLAVNGFKP